MVSGNAIMKKYTTVAEHTMASRPWRIKAPGSGYPVFKGSI